MVLIWQLQRHGFPWCSLLLKQLLSNTTDKKSLQFGYGYILIVYNNGVFGSEDIMHIVIKYTVN